LINQAANKSNILNVFTEASRLLGVGDLLVLFNASHGGQQWDTSGDEEDRKDETLCWWDGEVIDGEIAKYLEKLRVGVRVLTVSDTCNSGTNYRGLGRRERSTPADLTKRLIRLVDTRVLRIRLLHFGGCADGRSSYGTEQGGEFTKALIETMRKARKAIRYDQWFNRAAKKTPWPQVPVSRVVGVSFRSLEALT
jgi:hypothetical protein